MTENSSAPPTRGPAEVVIATLWYGPLPAWFPLTLRTMERNEDIDFLLIGDSAVPDYPLPTNVRLLSLSWRALKRRIRETLGIRFWGGVRKLCDLKPALGDLFAKEFAPYAWWAWADLDVVYGDVRRHLEAQGFEQLDAISTYALHTSSGPLMFLRNDEKCNHLYRRSPDWQRALRARRYVTFDEWWGKSGYHDFSRVMHEAASRDTRLLCAQLMADNRAYGSQDEVLHNSGRSCRWSAGKLEAVDASSTDSFEVLYFHFIDWKKKSYFDEVARLGQRVASIEAFTLQETELSYRAADNETVSIEARD